MYKKKLWKHQAVQLFHVRAGAEKCLVIGRWEPESLRMKDRLRTSSVLLTLRTANPSMSITYKRKWVFSEMFLYKVKLFICCTYQTTTYSAYIKYDEQAVCIELCESPFSIGYVRTGSRRCCSSSKSSNWRIFSYMAFWWPVREREREREIEKRGMKA